jgi:hypothetical protein
VAIWYNQSGISISKLLDFYFYDQGFRAGVQPYKANARIVVSSYLHKKLPKRRLE